MQKINFNNISPEQFLEILPVLREDYFFDITDSEIFLSLFPVWDKYEDHISEHIVCGYGEDDNGNLFVRPIGIMNSGHPAEGVWKGDECLHECVCLATGRYDGGNKIAFSTIQEYLPFTDSQEYMPCEIQAAGEAVLSKFYDDCKFGHTSIGSRSYITAYHANEDNNSSPFTTVERICPPPM